MPEKKAHNPKEPKIIPDQFQRAKEIIWDEVLDKIEWDSTKEPDTVKYLGNEIIDGKLNPDDLPTMILHSEYYPNSIQTAISEIQQLKEVKNITCLYVSFAKDAPTYGPISNKTDVLLVGGPGKVGYALTGIGETWLNSGDLLYIPAGTIYEEVTTGARATMRFDL
jgi:hypothetical protein